MVEAYINLHLDSSGLEDWMEILEETRVLTFYFESRVDYMVVKECEGKGTHYEKLYWIKSYINQREDPVGTDTSGAV